jgi:hypothetical protein
VRVLHRGVVLLPARGQALGYVLAVATSKHALCECGRVADKEFMAYLHVRADMLQHCRQRTWSKELSETTLQRASATPVVRWAEDRAGAYPRLTDYKSSQAAR